MNVKSMMNYRNDLGLITGPRPGSNTKTKDVRGFVSSMVSSSRTELLPSWKLSYPTLWMLSGKSKTSTYLYSKDYSGSTARTLPPVKSLSGTILQLGILDGLCS